MRQLGALPLFLQSDLVTVERLLRAGKSNARLRAEDRTIFPGPQDLLCVNTNPTRNLVLLCPCMVEILCHQKGRPLLWAVMVGGQEGVPTHLLKGHSASEQPGVAQLG